MKVEQLTSEVALTIADLIEKDQCPMLHIQRENMLPHSYKVMARWTEGPAGDDDLISKRMLANALRKIASALNEPKTRLQDILITIADTVYNLNYSISKRRPDLDYHMGTPDPRSFSEGIGSDFTSTEFDNMMNEMEMELNANQPVASASGSTPNGEGIQSKNGTPKRNRRR